MDEDTIGAAFSSLTQHKIDKVEFYYVYARKTARHNWNLYGNTDTIARARWLAQGLQEDAPGWEIVIAQEIAQFCTPVSNVKVLPYKYAIYKG